MDYIKNIEMSIITGQVGLKVVAVNEEHLDSRVGGYLQMYA